MTTQGKETSRARMIQDALHVGIDEPHRHEGNNVSIICANRDVYYMWQKVVYALHQRGITKIDEILRNCMINLPEHRCIIRIISDHTYVRSMLESGPCHVFMDYKAKPKAVDVAFAEFWDGCCGPTDKEYEADPTLRTFKERVTWKQRQQIWIGRIINKYEMKTFWARKIIRKIRGKKGWR